MYHLCSEHGHGEKWYLNFDSYLFNRIFPTPEQQEEAKKKMDATFSETEW